MYIKNATDSALTLTSDKVSVNLAPGKVAYVSDEDAKANVFQRMLSRGAITQVEDEYGRTAVKDDEDRMTAQREGSKAVVSKRKGIDENQIMLVPCGYTDRNGRACGCNVHGRHGRLEAVLLLPPPERGPQGLRARQRKVAQEDVRHALGVL